MKVIDCSTLETLIENREPVELIDVRSRNEFDAMHIPGARSLPLAELAAPKLFPRLRPTTERVCVISDEPASASLAIGVLRASGYLDPVVVDGGMKAWVAQGFPVLRNRFFPKISVFLGTGALLPGMAAVLALAWHEFVVAALLLVIVAALLLKANFFARMQGGRSDKLARRSNYKVLPRRDGNGFMEEMSL